MHNTPPVSLTIVSVIFISQGCFTGFHIVGVKMDFLGTVQGCAAPDKFRLKVNRMGNLNEDCCKKAAIKVEKLTCCISFETSL